MGIGLAFAGFQRGVVQEGAERILLALFVTELAGGGDQLAQVVQALLGFFALVLAVVIQQAAGGDHVFGGFRQP